MGCASLILNLVMTDNCLHCQMQPRLLAEQPSMIRKGMLVEWAESVKVQCHAHIRPVAASLCFENSMGLIRKACCSMGVCVLRLIITPPSPACISACCYCGRLYSLRTSIATHSRCQAVATDTILAVYMRWQYLPLQTSFCCSRIHC